MNLNKNMPIDPKYKTEVTKYVGDFRRAFQKQFLECFEVNRLDYGGELRLGDRTGFINWYSAERGDAMGGAVVTIACENAQAASDIQLLEVVLAEDRIYAMNQGVKETIRNSKVELLGRVEGRLSQIASSKLWIVTIAFEVSIFLGV